MSLRAIVRETIEALADLAPGFAPADAAGLPGAVRALAAQRGVLLDFARSLYPAVSLARLEAPGCPLVDVEAFEQSPTSPYAGGLSGPRSGLLNGVPLACGQANGERVGADLAGGEGAAPGRLPGNGFLSHGGRLLRGSRKIQGDGLASLAGPAIVGTREPRDPSRREP